MSDYVYFGNQDLGSLGYDRWKTDVPEYYDGEEECQHEEYEVDWNGEAHCTCGTHWPLTADELRLHEEAEARAARYHAAMERRERWSSLWNSVTWHLWWRWIPRKPIASDDEIPF